MMDQSSKTDKEKMENHCPGETELSEMKIVSPSVVTPTPNHPGDVQCRNGSCKISRTRTNPHSENPWHFLKTVFLISIIVALIIWIIVYTLLVKNKVL